MKNINYKILLKKAFILIIGIYVLYTFITQEQTLNAYKAEEKRYEKQIEEQKLKQKELNETKSNINSAEYIEEVAREKLDMYLPNERVYVDITK